MIDLTFPRVHGMALGSFDMKGWLYGADDWFKETVTAIGGDVEIPLFSIEHADLSQTSENFAGLIVAVTPPTTSRIAY